MGSEMHGLKGGIDKRSDKITDFIWDDKIHITCSVEANLEEFR